MQASLQAMVALVINNLGNIFDITFQHIRTSNFTIRNKEESYKIAKIESNRDVNDENIITLISYKYDPTSDKQLWWWE